MWNTCNDLWTIIPFDSTRPKTHKKKLICFDNRSQWMIITTSFLASLSISDCAFLFFLPSFGLHHTFWTYCISSPLKTSKKKRKKKLLYALFLCVYYWIALDHYLSYWGQKAKSMSETKLYLQKKRTNRDFIHVIFTVAVEWCFNALFIFCCNSTVQTPFKIRIKEKK